MNTKSVRVLADSGNKELRTVNISATVVAGLPLRLQKSTDSRQWETVQASGGTVAGLPTICIDGYSAPA